MLLRGSGGLKHALRGEVAAGEPGVSRRVPEIDTRCRRPDRIGAHTGLEESILSSTPLGPGV